jgi:pyridinium-3,5-biscarboxylic acid mononucleotide sulfurtransferase
MDRYPDVAGLSVKIMVDRMIPQPSPAELCPKLAGKWKRLMDILRDLPSAAIAYSGGVDSALVATAAYIALGDRMGAFTVRSSVEQPGETEAAAELAAQVGFRHWVVDFDDIAQPAFRANPPERCYFCKLERLKALGVLAVQEGLEYMLEGSNADDEGQRRPGRRAVKELGVRSPLAEAGLGKTEIRELTRVLGLPVWNKPSSPCLATRFPYGNPITMDGLQRVAQAEAYLQEVGYRQVRVRDYGNMARIEVAPEMVVNLAAEGREVKSRLLELGYKHITLDLLGYRTGSLDEVLEE